MSEEKRYRAGRVTLLLPLMLFIVLPAIAAQTLPEINSFSRQQIFANWVQSRCLGKIADSASLKDDANASAAAWLEASTLPVEAFEEADTVIDRQLKENVGGTGVGEYQVLKCTLIADSDAIHKLYGKNAE